MTLSEDEVDFRIFRVISKKLKEELGDQANKIKDRILEATYNYCTETVAEVNATYIDMEQKIKHIPENERELINTKNFIAVAPSKVEELTEVLKEVNNHFLMLEEFSYMYQEHDIDAFWYMKIWPLKIQAALTDGKNTIAEKNEKFSSDLENEKEEFTKKLVQFKKDFEKIKEY